MDRESGFSFMLSISKFLPLFHPESKQSIACCRFSFLHPELFLHHHLLHLSLLLTKAFNNSQPYECKTLFEWPLPFRFAPLWSTFYMPTGVIMSLMIIITPIHWVGHLLCITHLKKHRHIYSHPIQNHLHFPPRKPKLREEPDQIQRMRIQTPVSVTCVWHNYATVL